MDASVGAPNPVPPVQPTPATNYPFLVNLTAIRASDAARDSVNIDVLSDAFDHGRSSAGPPTLGTDDDARFASQMRARLADLGDRALETRELAAHHAALGRLVASAPTTSQIRAWTRATSSAVRRATRTLELDGGGGVGDEDAAATAATADADVLRLCDALDVAVNATSQRLSAACKPIDDRLAANYGWIRSQSTVLGIHGCTHARCPVCLVQQVTLFVDPCGHTFCEACSARTGDTTCSICRGAIHAKRKLFWCG